MFMKVPYLYFLALLTFSSDRITFMTANSIHGGTILAVSGRDSIILATDRRFTSYKTGPFLIGNYPRCVFRVGTNTVIGCFGLEADSWVLIDDIRKKLSSHNEDDLEPSSISRVVSDILYSSKKICSPVLAGVGTYGPYICSFDGLGAQTYSSNFVAGKLLYFCLLLSI